MASITTAQREELLALVVGMFNATPGATNLSALVKARENGATLQNIADALATKPQFETVYPAHLTSDEFADKLIANLLGNEVTDAAAKTWVKDWIKGQLAGGKTPATIITTAITALRATTNTAFTNAKTALANKVDVSTYFSVTKSLNDNDLIDLQGALFGVTSTAASVTAAKAAVDVIAGNVGSINFNLTIGTDTVVGSGGNDTINAGTDPVNGLGTLNALDSIDGGAGTDTLKIENTGALNEITGTITNVENLTFIGAGAVNNSKDVSASSFSGTLTLQQTDDIAVKFLSVGSQTIAVNKTGAAIAVDVVTTGTTVNLSNTSAVENVTFNVTGKATAANLSTNATASGKSVIVSGAALESATIAASGAAAVTVTSAALETVTITGAGLVTLTAATLADKLDASGSTGGVSYATALIAQTFIGGAGKDAITIGDLATKSMSTAGGDDTVTLGAGFTAFGTGGSSDGGEGTDTLKMTAAQAAALDADTVFSGKISNFEKLSLTAATVETVDLANLDGLNYVIEAGTGATLTLNNFASGGTLEMTDVSTTTAVTVKDAASSTADVFNVKLTNSASINFGTLTAANIETININADDTATSPLKDGSVAQTLALAADKATKVVVTGDAALVLNLNAADKVTSVDASANLAGVTVDLSLVDGSVTMLGSKGDDTITLGNLGTITGGEGDDTFVAVAPTNGSSYSTITDLGEGDSLEFAAAGDFDGDKIALADTAVFQDYLDAATADPAVAAGDISWFQFGGNTYVVQNVNAVATFQNGEDVVVKLTGLVDLSDAELAGDILTL